MKNSARNDAASPSIGSMANVQMFQRHLLSTLGLKSKALNGGMLLYKGG